MNRKKKKIWKCPHSSTIEVDGYYCCTSCGDVQGKVNPHSQNTHETKSISFIDKIKDQSPKPMSNMSKVDVTNKLHPHPHNMHQKKFKPFKNQNISIRRRNPSLKPMLNITRKEVFYIIFIYLLMIIILL